jgi:hypothetical protein
VSSPRFSDAVELVPRSIDDILKCIGHPRAVGFQPASTEERLVKFHHVFDAVNRIIPPRADNQVSCHHGYCGPWIEDVWKQIMARNPTDTGFCVPLIVPWLKMCLFFLHRYASDLSRILGLLSDRFIYVTVTQNDEGI